MAQSIRTLSEDATAFLKRLHQSRLRCTRNSGERRKLEQYDYSCFSTETFMLLAQERFTEREWLVFVRLFGLDGNPADPPTELASSLGITTSGIYTLKDAGYRKLRHVWDFIFAPSPWDGCYMDYDPLGVLPLSTQNYFYLARHGLRTVGEFKAIDEEFMAMYFSTRKLGASEIRTLQEKLLNK